MLIADHTAVGEPRDLVITEAEAREDLVVVLSEAGSPSRRGDWRGGEPGGRPSLTDPAHDRVLRLDDAARCHYLRIIQELEAAQRGRARHVVLGEDLQPLRGRALQQHLLDLGQPVVNVFLTLGGGLKPLVGQQVRPESLRQGIWWSVDPTRTRPPCVRKGMHQAWLEYALGADVMLVRDLSGHVHPVPPGLSFARWLAEGHITGYPTADDLRYHLTTLFPPIRPRGWLELRMLDALPSRLREVATIVATAALSPDAGAELARRLPPTAGLWCSAARYALAHPVLAEAARTLFNVVSCHLSHVGGDRSRRDAVHDYAERYVVRALAPAQLVSVDAFVNLFAPDLGPVMAVRAAV